MPAEAMRKVPLLIATIGLAVTAATAVVTSAEDSSMVSLPVEGRMPSLRGAVEWLNSRPLTTADLRGKVVLVDFWTYTCVNWTRTLPYLRAWAEKYKDKGLVVIGVHTPEFGFEKNPSNVLWAIKDMRVDYPVAVDSDYGIWNAFRNEYWPAEYFIDSQGRIRHHHFGEGAYDQSERVIQKLLAEAGNRDAGNALVSVDPQGLEVAADWADVESAENFLGFERTLNFASANGAPFDKPHFFSAPAPLSLNQWALSGNWTLGKEAVALNEANGRIAYHFHGRDLNLVMGPAKTGASIHFRILLDGGPPGSAHGADADAGGYGSGSRQRTYQLIRQSKPIVDRQFQIEFFDAGVEAFDFTFG
jgi:thiol-disulfide isomerase/thioredoxin